MVADHFTANQRFVNRSQQTVNWSQQRSFHSVLWNDCQPNWMHAQNDEGAKCWSENCKGEILSGWFFFKGETLEEVKSGWLKGENRVRKWVKVGRQLG